MWQLRCVPFCCFDGLSGVYEVVLMESLKIIVVVVILFFDHKRVHSDRNMPFICHLRCFVEQVPILWRPHWLVIRFCNRIKPLNFTLPGPIVFRRQRKMVERWNILWRLLKLLIELNIAENLLLVYQSKVFLIEFRYLNRLHYRLYPSDWRGFCATYLRLPWLAFSLGFKSIKRNFIDFQRRRVWILQVLISSTRIQI